MASENPTVYSSPKRKRIDPPTSQEVQNSEPPAPATKAPDMRLNTNVPGAEIILPDSDAQGSPRTKVAYNFQGLKLEDGGAVSKLDLQRSNAPKQKPKGAEDESSVRKRVRVLGADQRGSLDLGVGALAGIVTKQKEPRKEVAQPQESKAFTICIGPERNVDEMVETSAKGVVLRNEIDPVIFKGGRVDRSKASGALHRAYPSINRLSDSKSRGRKRMGTPPLFGSAEASLDAQIDAHDIVDPDRAALTWHDDEITGHDPDDPDDDGEGINGIGFKPTPAMAYARMEKRRQQMADYKSREAKEARAKRMDRRRGSEMSGSSGKSVEENEAERRVRFMEAEKMSIISTT